MVKLAVRQNSRLDPVYMNLCGYGVKMTPSSHFSKAMFTWDRIRTVPNWTRSAFVYIELFGTVPDQFHVIGW